ncbi:MAG: hypothetical protein P4L92_07360 [Rudaea sp.]|nr:hypothetical protein [Rudaea sp.]
MTTNAGTVPTIRDSIAKEIHYPACWDTAAYPTLEDAMLEMVCATRFACSECALLSASKPAVPEGWKLVPVEPTDDMQLAGAESIRFETTAINKIWTANKAYRAMLAASPAAPAQSGDLLGKNALVLTAAQLLEALDFIAPDRATDPEQMESEVAIEYGEGHGGKAMYCWCAEYPEEGSWVLDGKSALASPQPAPMERATTDDARDAARYRWLRQQHWSEAEMFVVAGSKSRVQLGTDCPSLVRLDEAVDAELGAAQPASGKKQCSST